MNLLLGDYRVKVAELSEGHKRDRSLGEACWDLYKGVAAAEWGLEKKNPVRMRINQAMVDFCDTYKDSIEDDGTPRSMGWAVRSLCRDIYASMMSSSSTPTSNNY